MKKTCSIVITALFLLPLLLTGCASNKVVLESVNPMAIFCISSNNSISWVDDGFNKDENIKKGGMLSDQLNKLVDANNPEHFTSQERLVFADKCLREKLTELAGIEVLEAEKLLKSEIYMETASSSLTYIESKDFLKGYKRIYRFGAKKNRLLMEDIGAKGMLHVEFVFEKKLLNGNLWNGEMTATGTMKVYIVDSKGKEQRPVEYFCQSAERLNITKRKYDIDQLIGLYPDVIENLVNKFVMDYIE